MDATELRFIRVINEANAKIDAIESQINAIEQRLRELDNALARAFTSIQDVDVRIK